MDSEEAARKLLVRHGYHPHKRLDECDDCTRLAALMFVKSLPEGAGDKILLAEWVASDGFYN